MIIVERTAEEVLTFYHSWHNKLSVLVCPGFQSRHTALHHLLAIQQYFGFCDQYQFFVWWEREEIENHKLHCTWDGAMSSHSTRYVQGSSPPRLQFTFAPTPYISSIFNLEFCCKTYCFFCKTHSIKSQINVYTSIWYL